LSSAAAKWIAHWPSSDNSRLLWTSITEGEVAKNLEHFYTLLRASLLEAQINPSKTILETQITNLLSLREAWIEVEHTSRASAHPPVSAQGVAAAEASSGDRAPSNWKA